VKRRLLNVLTLLSLLCFVAVAVTWPFVGGQVTYRWGPPDGRQKDITQLHVPGLSYSHYVGDGGRGTT
jgi:hypothetical protein